MIKYSYFGFKVSGMSGSVTAGVTLKFQALTLINGLKIDSNIKEILDILVATLPSLVEANTKYEDMEAALRLIDVLKQVKNQYMSITDFVKGTARSTDKSVQAIAIAVQKKFVKETATDLFIKGSLSEKLNNMLSKVSLFSKLTDEQKNTCHITNYVNDFTTIANSYVTIYGTTVSDNYDAKAGDSVTTINTKMKAYYKRLKEVIVFVQGGKNPNDKFVSLANDIWKKEATGDATSATAKKKAEDKAKAEAKEAADEAAKNVSDTDND